MRRAISNLFLCLTLAAGGLSTTGCLNDADSSQESEYAGSSTAEEGAAFRDGKAAWLASKPNAYSFQYRRACFCLPYGKMEISVDSDKVVKVDSVVGEALDPESVQYAPTIDEVFNQIEGFLNNAEYEVKASYDEKMGYPVQVQIHHLREYTDADEEIDISVFHPRS